VTTILSRIPASAQSQAKAFLGGLVAAVVAAEAPLVQGGHWSLNTLYAAAVSAVVGYGLVYLKANGPSEVNALLALLVGAADTGKHVAVQVGPVAVPTVVVPAVSAVTNRPIPPVEPAPVAPTPYAP
jgi:hypothetical protein